MWHVFQFSLWGQHNRNNNTWQGHYKKIRDGFKQVELKVIV